MIVPNTSKTLNQDGNTFNFENLIIASVYINGQIKNINDLTQEEKEQILNL
jgi:hypothetical protein